MKIHFSQKYWKRFIFRNKIDNRDSLHNQRGENMGLITGILIVFAVLLMFFFAILENKRTEKRMDENHFTVRMPKVFLLVGISGFFFGCGALILMTLFSNDTVDFWTYSFFSLYTGMCPLFFICCISWKIRIDDDQIMYSPFIGIKKNFTISDITQVKIRYGELKVYNGKKKLFAVGSMYNGHKVLAARLQREEHIQFEF